MTVVYFRKEIEKLFIPTDANFLRKKKLINLNKINRVKKKSNSFSFFIAFMIITVSGYSHNKL